MRVTVIICTYNRCKSLTVALNSAVELSVPESVEWEALIVDNNSTDETHKVVENFCRQYPGRFRYLFEPNPGKSHALNAGVREAHGDILAFMDDDVRVHPLWLQNLTSALNDPNWAGVGGRIFPEWTNPPPRWLPVQDRYALAPLAMFDLGAESGTLSEPPFGTNMAFRKTMFDTYGGFRVDLGPRPGSEIRSEDTEFGSRLLAAGERLRYEPNALVYHSVAENRLEKRYFLRWWFDKGRAEIRQSAISYDTGSRCAGIPVRLVGSLGIWAVHWMLAVHPSQRFHRKIKVWTKCGQIFEYHSRRPQHHRITATTPIINK
jgi:glycosyltransferase involved in cell wall biosynthesis